jgi:hypothetical protein
MTLAFGVKLASATPILLTFDWTGQCDDCQGPNGAIDVPGTNWNDGYTQTVSGKLIMSYDAQLADAQQALRYVRFDYFGSSILYPTYGTPDPINATLFKRDWHIYNGNIFLDYVSIRMSQLRYKGDWADLDSEGALISANAVFSSVGVTGRWDIQCRTAGIVCNGGHPPVVDSSSPRGGGSRDAGFGSSFVMRGTLPSPLASPIPEPSTIAIFALGMVGLSLRRQKRI